jgi:hypothetical protein
MSDREKNQSQLRILSKEWLNDRNAMIKMAIHNIRVNGFRGGIYGAEVCQLCGEVKTFSGWAAATYLHVGNSGFTCSACCRAEQRRIDPTSSEFVIGSGAFANIRAQLANQPIRYCQVCRSEVPAEPDYHVDRHWLCRDCRNVIDSIHPHVSPEDVLGNLVRVRHVWLACRTAEDLRRFGVRIEATRRALEEIMSESDGKGERKSRDDTN